MTALIKARTDGSRRFIQRDLRPLAANAKVWRGGLAVAVIGGVTSSGYYEQGQAGSVTAVGRFTQDVDNTGGADGALSAEIEFFTDRWIFLLKNDTVSAVVVADRESACFVLDDQTVTHASAGNGVAGVVYDVTSDGVWVEVRARPPEQGASVPNIQAGTSTLIAGTKTITGVQLTATSRIFVTMKDPGAGAITGLGAFDAPVASRNTGTGQFVVNAIDDSKAVITTAVCTFDWMIVG
jgi:hypothetical protein